jgi:ligand-binding SRPBCC domain-containing protein
MIYLAFRSALHSPAGTVWDAAVSIDGINDEAMPLFRMTAPKGIKKLTDLQMVTGQILFRSRIYAFGFIPIDWSDLTLDSITPGHGFVERSTMMSMHSWQHVRTIEPDGTGCVLTDQLTFSPRLPPLIARFLIGLAFRNRHRNLRKKFGHRADAT